ncbi:MAG: family 16 glycosylhydrolase [Lutibacter sp.]
MKFFKKLKFLYKVCAIFSIAILFSCGGSSDQNDELTLTPSNLTINAKIVGASISNPNGDGSGIINFSISATNATSYKVLLGNGETKEVTNGNFTYTYTASGTNSYTVYVSAYNLSKFVSTSLTITIFVSPTATWSDEFNVDGSPNNSKWGYDLGAGGWGNNEEQYYTNRPENVIVQNGVLKIKTLKENFNGSSYTSARILSKGKFSFKYGKVEIKAKLPSGGGIWPALWMLGNNIDNLGWPACGEIDIMENVGNSPNKIYGTLHHPGHSGGNGDGATTIIANASTEFHIYTLDWRADSIKFYVDNQLFYTFTNSANLPFNQNFFIIINTAIGGNFGGTIDPNFISSTFEIDYIRVYN